MSEDTSALPAPLTPPNCDLMDFPYMELDVRQLRDSKFAAAVEAEAFRAGVLLWAASWHQVPAASLPDDDVELAGLAGFGRVVKEWLKVRNEALHGFVKCSDGRFYHAVIAVKANTAFEAKQRHRYDRFRDRLRKENKARKEAGHPELGTPSLEQWKTGAYDEGIPPETGGKSAGIPRKGGDSSAGIPPESPINSGGKSEFSGGISELSAGIPAENALKGRGRGKGNKEVNLEAKKHSPPAVASGPAAPSYSAKAELLDAGVSEQTAVDWLALRKAKKAPVSRTALDAIKREANTTGMTLDSTLALCCTRGWQGFKAEWVTQQAVRAGPGQAAGTVYAQTMANAERAKARIFGNAAPQGDEHDAG